MTESQVAELMDLALAPIEEWWGLADKDDPLVQLVASWHQQADTHDWEAAARKIEAAQTMATMIKRFLDHYGETGNSEYRRRTKDMREALEAYRNA